ncbi:MAG: 4Fe-4S dicluster domain-containing protein, partial [Firmicutes bacterium]|nr:4Fe-4S dicluster domain-containing protein [Bacillota bacterium]
MDWERCIGCRYCEVACPYGVNSFNWKEPRKNYYLNWNDEDLGVATGGAVPPYRNPDLDGALGPEQRRIAGGGHRKGIVEKCSFCVHRVEKGLLPACVANCPTMTLNFGDLDDSDSRVSRLLREKPSFQLLEEQNTQPRVHYLGGQAPGKATKQIEEPKVRV